MTTTGIRRAGVVLCVAAAMIGAACSSDADDAATAADNPAGDDTTSVAAEPRYADAGPYEVGITTLTLDDGRAVEVYYPAQDGSTDAGTPAVYLQTDAIPPEVLATLPTPPADVDLSVELPATRDVPASGDGPFPLVLFSHGAGGWRSVYGYQLSGLAAWGFVVASIDYPEYGMMASFTGGTTSGGRDGTASVAATTIAEMAARSADPESVLSGTVDTTRVAGAGRSTGAATMFGLLDDGSVGAVVGWAPANLVETSTSDTPSLIIAAENDIAITVDDAEATYANLADPKRLVIVGDMGHNGFGDSCLAIREGTDVIGVARDMGIPIPDRLLELGRNGCEEGDLDPRIGWAVTQHFTVAFLRDAFGIDAEPVGLGDGIGEAFDGVSVTYRQSG